jgi:hypothetical protein
VTYSTPADTQNNEGAAEILVLTNRLVRGPNVIAVEVHQTGANSSDVAFGMQLNAVYYSTNVITNIVAGLPIVLNEAAASSIASGTEAAASDWVELYNPSETPVDLADASLTDDSMAPRKFVFAGGTIIAAHGRLVVRCDGTARFRSITPRFHCGQAVDPFCSLPRRQRWRAPRFAHLRPADARLHARPHTRRPVPGRSTFHREAKQTLRRPGFPSALSINEWMADPVSGPDWFELCNGDNQPVSIGGLVLADDLADPTVSRIPPLSFIGVGPHGFVQFLADGVQADGADHVNFRLSKSGEELGLFSPAGTLITATAFNAQLTGVSQGRFPDGSANITSFTSPSPGESNYLPIQQLTINELLSHTDPPFEDAVELWNPGLLPLAIGGWYLSDSAENLKKFRISENTQIAPRSYHVFYEYQFNAAGGSSIPFTFNSARGGRLYISAAGAAGELTGYRLGADFGPAARSISFGRHTNSIGEVDFAATQSPTFGVSSPGSVDQFRSGTGASNSDPLVGPVVIDEIMASPALLPSGERGLEFLELRNASVTSVRLFDPNAPTNTWKIRGGVDFTFPAGATLGPGETLLVVSFNPAIDVGALADFRSRYQVPAQTAIYGPYQGQLENNAEVIELRRPDAPQLPPHPDAGYVPYIAVDHIYYRTAAPWPSGADGTGASLQRKDLLSYGNEPLNWTAAAPTAGRPNSAAPDDTNADGLPDSWQTAYLAHSQVSTQHRPWTQTSTGSTICRSSSPERTRPRPLAAWRYEASSQLPAVYRSPSPGLGQELHPAT